jgi:4-aminobutyrate aminotransferase / (S)-3-amino-2-methylpropionate transaminase / 5-aminovalerate transaminase
MRSEGTLSEESPGMDTGRACSRGNPQFGSDLSPTVSSVVPNASSPLGTCRTSDPNFVPEFVKGEGCYLWDAQGKRYLDFVSGYSSTVFGHCHPRLVAAAREQLEQLTQLVGLRHPWRSRLESLLAKRCQATVGEPSKVWLTTTGARAVEVAWKIAYATRPGAVVAFDIAFHGRSLASALLSHTRSLPIVKADVEKALPYPRCDACPVGLRRETCQAECFDASEQWLVDNGSRISAVLIEPAAGARGYYFAPAIFFQRLRDLTKRLGILLIDDEVQMGFGRMGSFLAAQRQGWQPDLVVMGKSLGGGLVPMAAVVGRADIMDALPSGYESETFAGNPLACRIAIEAIATLEEERLIERSLKAETYLQANLQKLAQDSSISICVDCYGAAGVIQASPNDAASLAKDCLASGLLVHWSGIDSDRIVLIPPLIAGEREFEEALAILSRIL